MKKRLMINKALLVTLLASWLCFISPSFAQGGNVVVVPLGGDDRLDDRATVIATGDVSSGGGVHGGFGIARADKTALGEYEIYLEYEAEDIVAVATSYSTVGTDEIVTVRTVSTPIEVQIVRANGTSTDSRFLIVVYGRPTGKAPPPPVAKSTPSPTNDEEAAPDDVDDQGE